MRGFRVIAVGLAVIVLGATGVMAWLGYFGGPVFTDLPATGPRAPYAHPYAVVFLSGDIGFNTGLGRDVATRLAADGVPVVGVNMLTYLRQTRTPADITTLIADAERRALQLGHTDRVVLVGLSFGADMLHVGLIGLPAELRARVRRVALVVPEDNVQFRASPSEIFDLWTPSIAALPTARQLTWTPVLCVQGQEEVESLCPLMTQTNAHRVALPGGHPLHRDADALYDVLARFVFAH